MAQIQKVVVIGAGNMGSGIAQSAAQAGCETTMVDQKQEFIDKAMKRLRAPLEKRVEAGKMTQEKVDAIFENLTGSTDAAEAVKDADLVIEAVFEEFDVKKEIFETIAPNVPKHAIVATNTSSLSVTDLGKAFGTPERFAGLHYFYPAMINKLVEVVRGEGTSDETFEALWAFAERCRKIPIDTADSAGFCVNRFFVPFLNEACRLLEEDVADIPTIEAAAKDGFGIGMGPFELMNVTGIPIAYHSQESLHEAFGEFYEPSAALKKQFEAKEEWDLEGDVAKGKKEAVQDRLFGVTFGIACHLVDEGVATREATDRGAVVGLRWAQGPFALMNRMATPAALALVKKVNERWGDAFPVPKSLREVAAAEAPWDLRVVRYEVGDHVATITIDRPEALNALNPTVIGQLNEAFSQAEADTDVRTIVLTGTGRSFVAGADIKTMAEQTAVESIAYTQQGQDLVRRIELLPKPVIGAVNGWALGGGCELALACDLLVASEKAQFALPEVGLGIHPGFGGTQRLPRAIGPMRAKEWIFTGERFNAEAAHAVGLVNKVVADGETLAEAKRIAAKIAEHAPLAIGLAKGVVNRGLAADLETGLALERQSVTMTFATKDQKEGMRAFLERRKPDFRGE